MIFSVFLGNGVEFGLKHLNYTYQEAKRGIAAALALAEHFSKGEKIVVILGDRTLEKDIKKGIERFAKQEKGARIFLKEVGNPSEYGVAGIKRGNNKYRREAPFHTESNYAVTGEITS